MDAALLKRDRCEYRFGRQYCYSEWYYWGRWVLAGIAVLVILLFILSCCFTARRRRKRGMSPYYGTGWMAPGVGKYGQNNADFYNGQNQAYPMNPSQNNNYGGGYVHNPPPAYGDQQQQYTGTTFNPNDGYYGQQQQNYGGPGGQPGGVQSPPNAYRPDHSYPPPPGPPPGK